MQDGVVLDDGDLGLEGPGWGEGGLQGGDEGRVTHRAGEGARGLLVLPLSPRVGLSSLVSLLDALATAERMIIVLATCSVSAWSLTTIVWSFSRSGVLLEAGSERRVIFFPFPPFIVPLAAARPRVSGLR